MKRIHIQLLSFITTNAYVKGFFSGRIFKGPTKYVCVPGLNCYSCPGALGACPIGALQAVLGSIKYQMSYYVLGLLMVFGTVFGRFVCGYLCPFGMVQDVFYKLRTRKFKIPKLFLYIKYIVLVYFVILIPTVFTSKVGIGAPGFCKYICPSGTLLGALPLLLKNEGLRAALGVLFGWKMLLLITVLTASVFVYRIFCKVLCPLGLIYGWFNRFSFLGYRVEEAKCTHCNVCTRTCKMDLDPVRQINSVECIRCGECKRVCPSQAIKRRTL